MLGVRYVTGEEEYGGVWIVPTTDRLVHYVVERDIESTIFIALRNGMVDFIRRLGYGKLA